MDSLAYSVMLEVKANTSNLNKDLQKSLTIANDYHKQMQKNFDGDTKAVKGYINAHNGLNKVYKEELSWWGKIGHAVGSTLKFMLTLPLRAAAAIGSIAVGIIKATATAIVAAISYIDKYIEQAMDRYDKMIEEYRFANIQAAGSVGLLHDRMSELMIVTGATEEEAKKIAFGLANAGFRAQEMGEDFSILTETLWGFERITGVSAKTSAALAKSLQGVGFNAEGTRKIFVDLAKQAYAGSLNTSELTSVMENLREEMYLLKFAFDDEAVVKYSKALGELAGAAKMVGVNVSKANKLMTELNNNPMKFVVALGSDAFYKSAGDNMETLIKNLDKMKSSLENVPPGFKPKLLQDIYGIDAATFKMLEGMDEFRKKYPALRKWGEMLAEANSSLQKMYDIIYSKIMGVFNMLAQRFAKVRIEFMKAFTKDIPEKIQNLFAAIINFIDKVFDVKVLGKWGDSIGGWVSKLNQWFGGLIDRANEWITALSQPESIALIKEIIDEIYNIFDKKIIPAVIRFATSLKDWVVGAAMFVWDILKSIFNYVDGWVESGGPQRLLDKFIFIGETLLWILENPLKAIGIYLAVTILPTIILIAPAIIAAFAPILPILAAIAVGLAIGNAIAKLFTGDISAAVEETRKLNKLASEHNKILGKTASFEKSLLGLSKEQAETKLKMAIQELSMRKAAAEAHAKTQKRFAKDSGYFRRGKYEDKAKEYEDMARGYSLELDIMREQQRSLGAGELKLKSGGSKGAAAAPAEESISDAISSSGDRLEEKFKRLIDIAKSGNILTTDQNADIKKLVDKDKDKDKSGGGINRFDLLIKKLGKVRHEGKDGVVDRWEFNELVAYEAENLKRFAKAQNKELSDAEAEKLASSALRESLEKAEAAKKETEQIKKATENKAETKVEAAKKETEQIKKAAETKTKAEQQANAPKIGEETAKSKRPNTTAKGSSAGLKAEHVSAASQTPPGAQTINFNKDQFKELAEMVEIGGRQVVLLDSIDKKIGGGEGRYNRNDPPMDEVTSTIWGN